MHLSATVWTAGDTLALVAIIVTLVGIGVGIVGGLWKVSQLLGGMLARLDDHGRRLDVIETASVDGPQAGRLRRRELSADGDARLESPELEGPGAVRGPVWGPDHPRGNASRRQGSAAGTGHV